MSMLTMDPFESLLQLQRELERALTAPLMNFGWGGANVFPPVNVFTDKEGLVIRAEVPGIRPDELNVTMEPRRLTLQGERRPAEPDGKAGGYHRRERPFGRFSRTMQLPEDLDTAKATAECKNGLLTIRIPKAEAALPRQIEIKAS